jgi:hypothetical protein
MPRPQFYEYNLRNRCTTREQLFAEQRLLQTLIKDARTDEQRAALGERLATVARVIEELSQTTLAL